MQPDAYCEQRAAPPGSSLYYSLLFAAPSQRAALLALHALRAELTAIANECTEPAVAGTRLAWWRYQIESIYDDVPAHPVARALVPVIEAHDLPREQFQELLDGVEMTLAAQRLADAGELSLYCHRVDGTLALLGAEVCGYEDHHTPRCIHELGMGMCLAQIILDVAADPANRQRLLPIDAAIRDARGPADGTAEILRRYAQQAHDHFRSGLTRLPEGDRLAQLHWLILTAIHRATLNELERTDYVARRRGPGLSPLRKLWIAWVTQRRERRRHRGQGKP